jgi:steroid delta-isomerase-like uncharacterized protein
MTRGEVRDLVERYVDALWNRGDAAALESLTAPGFAYRLGGQPARDRTAMAEFIAMVHRAFPDWRVAVVDVITDEEGAAVRWEGEVTHAGPFQGIPATGRRLKVSGINLYRVAGGRIEAEWEQMDTIGMLVQMGAVPGAG